MHALGDRGQRQGENDERCDPEWDVDEEDPAPREMGREEAPDQRACDAGETEDGAEDALVTPAVPRRDYVADRRLCRHHQTAAAEPLHRPEGDQLGQVLRDPAQDRADQEHHQPDLEHDLPAVQIAELPVQRRHDRLREQVRRHDPADVVESPEFSHDRRERGRDDCAVECCKQHHQHEAGEDDVDVARAPSVGEPFALRHTCERRRGHRPSLRGGGVGPGRIWARRSGTTPDYGAPAGAFSAAGSRCPRADAARPSFVGSADERPCGSDSQDRVDQ